MFVAPPLITPPVGKAALALTVDVPNSTNVAKLDSFDMVPMRTSEPMATGVIGEVVVTTRLPVVVVE